jgi:hypothetical protein
VEHEYLAKHHLFFDHERLVYEYVTSRNIDKVTVGGVEFTVTKDSFKLNELDYKTILKLCRVCSQGSECELRFRPRQDEDMGMWFCGTA